MTDSLILRTSASARGGPAEGSTMATGSHAERDAGSGCIAVQICTAVHNRRTVVT